MVRETLQAAPNAERSLLDKLSIGTEGADFNGIGLRSGNLGDSRSIFTERKQLSDSRGALGHFCHVARFFGVEHEHEPII